MRSRKFLAASAALVASAMALSACGGGGGSGTEDGDVTLTFWHNSTTGPGMEYWKTTAAAFEDENPGVTIRIQAIQNEDMDGSSRPP